MTTTRKWIAAFVGAGLIAIGVGLWVRAHPAPSPPPPCKDAMYQHLYVDEIQDGGPPTYPCEPRQHIKIDHDAYRRTLMVICECKAPFEMREP